MAAESVTLRPVDEDDLPLLERFLTEQKTAGPFQWYGYTDPRRFRQRWTENRLLGEDGGQLIVTAGDEPLGFVAWRKVVVTASTYCWNMGAQLLPEARGRGIGTRAQLQLVCAHGQARPPHLQRSDGTSPHIQPPLRPTRRTYAVRALASRFHEVGCPSADQKHGKCP